MRSQVVLTAVVLAGLLLVQNALAASVVLVPTQGSRSWQVAEARLVAELRAMGIDIALLPPKPADDRELPLYARIRGSVAAIQLQRNSLQGVVRVWLPDPEGDSGEYRHVKVDSRGANVVSEAVLPSVELVIPQVARFAEFSRSRQAPVLESSCTTTGDCDLGPGSPDVERKNRAQTVLAPRLGMGFWLSDGIETAAVSLSLGLRVRLSSVLFVSSEVTAQPIPHKVSSSVRGRLTVFLAEARSFLMLEPWSSADVSGGIGVGGGFMQAYSSLDGKYPDLAWTSVVAARVSIATEVAPAFDAAFVLTGSWGLRRVPVETEFSAPTVHLLEPGIEAMLALDWLWW